MQEELAIVGKSEGVLTRDASGDLVNEKFAERNVDGGGRLEIADGRENVGGYGVAIGDAAHLAAEVVMAERSVAGIGGGGAALAVSAMVMAAAVWRRRM